MSNVYPIRGGDWRERVDYKQNRRGDREIVHTLANALTILRNDPAWRGVLAWDELAQGIVCRKVPPWYSDAACVDDADGAHDPKRPWSETDALRLMNWLQRKWALSISPERAYSAALMVAEANRYDPLRDWLLSLKHDGVKRVDGWLSAYFGVEDTEYSRFVGRLFIVGSVARPLNPGCKFDTMLILEGPQGKGKSEGIRRLYGDEYFRESPIDLRDKDRFLSMRGCWCREWPELDGLGKAETNRVKSFVSARVDDFRPPYGRGYVSAPRRNVLVGTVNPPQLGYLTDESGNRRMLPIECGAVRPIDFGAIDRDRVQLWAEAVALYKAGVLTYASTDAERALCNQEQEARMTAEVWIGKIQRWLDDPSRVRADVTVTVYQVLTECLGVPADKCERGNSTRVGSCLSRLGWAVAGRRSDGDRERYYTRRAAEPIDDDTERPAIQAEGA